MHDSFLDTPICIINSPYAQCDTQLPRPLEAVWIIHLFNLSFPRKWESIQISKFLDSRLHGNDHFNTRSLGRGLKLENYSDFSQMLYRKIAAKAKFFFKLTPQSKAPTTKWWHYHKSGQDSGNLISSATDSCGRQVR